MRYLFICLLFIAASCSSSTKEFDDKLQLVRSNDYMFYKTIDLNSRKWGDSINTPTYSQLPFYAIKTTSEKIYTYKFNEDKTNLVKHYTIFHDYLLCTTISKELEFENFYIREVEVIKRDLKIIYNYQINDNYEFLDYIDFVYVNGKDIRYYNCNKKHYGVEDYKVNIREQDISRYYPSFKVECE
jgi:hypothetical protein